MQLYTYIIRSRYNKDLLLIGILVNVKQPEVAYIPKKGCKSRKIRCLYCLLIWEEAFELSSISRICSNIRLAPVQCHGILVWLPVYATVCILGSSYIHPSKIHTQDDNTPRVV